ncbi:MAG: S41 family peptidase [Alphaproteobacteria bacterium]|nr:S41 family peptidase [Alphaproteobacteria bacterium]
MKKVLLLGIAFLMSFNAVAGEVKKTPATEKTAKDDPYLLLELFGEAFKSAREEYVDETSDKKLIEAAINGMLSSLDPHSGFLNEEDFQDMTVQTKGEFGGLGIEVTMENGWVRVVSPIDDTPASRAGIQPGDLITHIDGISVMGLSLNEAVDKMRGKPKTDIKLSISRKKAEPFDVTITRDIIKIEAVKYEAKGNVGYIRIISFSETTTNHLHKAINELTKEIGQDKLAGFLIDLRNNPGGLLDQAIGVTDTFLEQGEIVSTRSKRPEETIRVSATKGDLTKGAPIVVLINEGSASASEIVSGALQDHKRAVVVGTPSFGKGSVQSISPIPGFGAIKLTTARYYTPSGRSIQAKGIQPDVLIPRAEIKELPMIEGYSENNLPKALGEENGEKNEEVKDKKTDKKDSKKDSEKKAEKNVKEKDEKPVDPANEDESKKEEEKKDYQLDRALDILNSIAVYQQGRENK